MSRQHVDILRMHDRRGRLVKMKADGTEAGNITIEEWVTGVARKTQVEQLADNLPKCECCGRRVVPADRRIYKNHILCAACPSCTKCGKRLAPYAMAPSIVAKRGGRPPMCRSCALKAVDPTVTKARVDKSKAAGSGRPRALDERAISEIVARANAGEVRRQLAREFGVSPATITGLMKQATATSTAGSATE